MIFMEAQVLNICTMVTLDFCESISIYVPFFFELLSPFQTGCANVPLTFSINCAKVEFFVGAE